MFTAQRPDSPNDYLLPANTSYSGMLKEEMRKLAEIFLEMFVRLPPEQHLLYEAGNTAAVA